MISKTLISQLRIVLAILIAATVNTCGAATFIINNLDGPGEGLNDPTAFTPVGGNPATTVGQARLNVFQYAADVWGGYLVSNVPIELDCSFDPMSCGPDWAILGGCGPQSSHHGFTASAPYTTPPADILYVQALANAMHGSDVNPAQADIAVRYNSNLGATGCMTGWSWYYGLDGNPPANTIDLCTVVLHELAHGLGFTPLVNLDTGARNMGHTSAYITFLEHHGHTPLMYPDMTDQQRVAASIGDPNLHWTGPYALAEATATPLTAGFPGGHIQMYAPNPHEHGSSVSHFSDVLTPDNLSEPFITGANNPFLTVQLLHDTGWQITAPEGDLYMKDTPFDAGIEPNPDPGCMSISQDIYVRNTNDGSLAANVGVHQNPEYKTVGSNYVYVRVHNRGSRPASGELKVYWACAAAGLAWPTNWVNYVASKPGCTATLFGDQIHTAAPLMITNLAPSTETIIEVPWNVPNPADYACFGNLKSHFCLLARIETESTPPYGMTFLEGTGIHTNVRNNNNIVWKNVTVVDDLPNLSIGVLHLPLIVRNTGPRRAPHVFHFDMAKLGNTEDFSKYGTLEVRSPEVANKWKEGKARGAGVELVDADTWRILTNKAWIGNIVLDPGEWHLLDIRLKRHTRPKPPTPHLFELNVSEYQTEADGTETLIGGQLYSIDMRKTLFFPFGSVWKYFDKGYLPGKDWNQLSFKSEAEWPSGSAQLGFGTGAEATTVNGGPVGSRFVTTYFRQTFQVEDAAFLQYLNFRLKRDDGAVVYLNGQEIFRNNMPEGPLDYTTRALAAADDDGAGIFTTTIAVEPKMLLSGTNLVAVEVHQDSVTSDDLAFDLELKANGLPNPPEVKITQPVGGSVIKPGPVEIRTSAIDSDGSIAWVEFYAGTVKLGESHSAPYSFTWTPAEPGAWGITAKAVDKTSLTTQSVPVIVTVGEGGWPPFGVTPVKATASSSKAGSGPERTIDSSGLNADHQHSTNGVDMWLSNSKPPQWIQYEFDQVYQFAQMWVWNYNTATEPFLGFGAKDVTIDCSADGVTWMALTTSTFAMARGDPSYVYNTVVDLGGVAARYIRLNIKSTWGGSTTACGLSEVKFIAKR